MKLLIKDFLKHQLLEFEFLKPITIIYGPNSGGKTSIIDAIEWLYTNTCRGLKGSRELTADMVINRVGKEALVSLDSEFRSRNKSKMNASPTLPDYLPPTLNGFRFLEADSKQRAAWIQTAAPSKAKPLTVEALEKEGIPKKYSVFAVAQSWEKARKIAEETRRDAKTKATTYKQQIKDIIISDHAPIADIEKELASFRGRIEDIRSADQAVEKEKTCAEKIKEITKQIDHAQKNQHLQKKIDKLNNQLREYDKTIAETTGKLRDNDQLIQAIQKAQCPILGSICPAADKLKAIAAEKEKDSATLKNLLSEFTTLEKDTVKEVKDLIRQKVDTAPREQLENDLNMYQHHLKEAQHRIETSNGGDIPVLEAEAEEISVRLTSAKNEEWKKKHVEDIKNDLESTMSVIEESDLVYKLCAPDQLPQKFTETNQFKEVLDRLSPLLFPNSLVEFDNAWNFNLNSIRFELCAENEKMRFAFLIQAVFTILQGCPFMFLDHGDKFYDEIKGQVKSFLWHCHIVEEIHNVIMVSSRSKAGNSRGAVKERNNEIIEFKVL